MIKKQINLNIFIWLLSTHRYSYSPLSASCFDARLFIWFKLDNSSRLSCFSRLLNRTIFRRKIFRFFSSHKFSFTMIVIDFSSPEKKNLNFYFSSTFIFYSNQVFYSYSIVTLARTQKFLIAGNSVHLLWLGKPFKIIKIMVKIVIVIHSEKL